MSTRNGTNSGAHAPFVENLASPSLLAKAAQTAVGKVLGALAVVIILALVGTVYTSRSNALELAEHSAVIRGDGKHLGLVDRVTKVEGDMVTIKEALRRIDAYVQRSIEETDAEQKATIARQAREIEQLKRGRGR